LARVFGSDPQAVDIVEKSQKAQAALKAMRCTVNLEMMTQPRAAMAGKLPPIKGSGKVSMEMVLPATMHQVARWQFTAAGTEQQIPEVEEAFWRSERERRLYELREKALRNELVMLEGARAEGKAEMAQEAICRYLEARFGEASQGLQKKVQQLNKLEILDQIMNKIYTADSLEDARAVIEGLPGT